MSQRPRARRIHHRLACLAGAEGPQCPDEHCGDGCEECRTLDDAKRFADRERERERRARPAKRPIIVNLEGRGERLESLRRWWP